MVDPAGPLGPSDEERQEGERGGLARVAVGGVAWHGLSYLLGKLLVLVSTAILARVLTPEDFGVVGLALVFVMYADVVTDLGVAQALVYLPEKRSTSDAALALALAFAALLVGSCLLAAPLVASFFDRPDITNMFRVLSLSLLFAAAGQVPDALLRRSLAFKKRLVAELVRASVQGAVSIGLALAGAGPWAIIYGYLIGHAFWSIALWIQSGHRPSARFWRIEREDRKKLLAYGVPAAGNALLLSLVFNIDYLIIGRQLGSEALGYYTLAFRIPQMAIINVFYVLSGVAFPLFSRARDDPARLRRGYVTGMKLQTVYGVAAGAGMAVAAPLLITVIFGDKWQPSIVPLQALALYAAFRSLGIGAVDLYKAVGRPGVAATLSVVRLVVLAPALFIAAGAGIDAVSWTQAAVALGLAIMMQVVATRFIELPLSQLALAFAPAIAAGIGVAAAAMAVRLWLPGPDIPRLVATVAAGGAGGLAALWLADRGFVKESMSLIRSRRTAAST